MLFFFSFCRMYPLSRWVTPEHEKYRYDTIFYVAPLRVSPQVVLDGSVFFFFFFLLHDFVDFFFFCRARRNKTRLVHSTRGT